LKSGVPFFLETKEHTMTDPKRSGEAQKLSYDEFAWQLADHLLEDFSPFAQPALHTAAKAASAARSVEQWRALTCGTEDANPYTLKTSRQITELLKKFSFSQDLRTPAQLLEDSVKKFMDNQERLSNFSLPDDPLTKGLVFGARGYADQILGDFSGLEICERATFGKKSSVGIPMRHACEGARYEAPITGSSAHIEWFDKYYGIWNRPALEYAKARAALLKEPPYREIDTLEAVLVDKTWKSLRMIMPNTTLGSLYSGGLGRVIEDRLRAYGYDIKHLQPVHGELARFGSLTGQLVTADQSMASDNITVMLVDAILHHRWASALKFGRIERIRLYGRELITPTFSTMGIGFTFPLQTLIFLVLLLAIRDHCGLDESAVVSVFGDDLVYDSRMHEAVMQVFPRLGLVINADKTFAEGEFRESCGYDYFRGIDVRPFHLGRATGTGAGKRRAEAYLYTCLNGLLRRWEVYEIPLTAKFLVEEIRRVREDECLLVPTDYPDTSGIKASPETAYLLGVERKARKQAADGCYHFRYLAFEPEPRVEDRHAPYLYRALSTTAETWFPPSKGLPLRKMVGDLVRERPPLFGEVDDPDRRSLRSAMSGRRLRPRLTTIPHQDRGRYRERSGVTGNWTPGS
jgi:hypothetical protein